MFDLRNEELSTLQYFVVIIYFHKDYICLFGLCCLDHCRLSLFMYRLFSPKTERDSLVPALFVKSERNITCRNILNAFISSRIAVEEVMDNISCMIHLSLCL